MHDFHLQTYLRGPYSVSPPAPEEQLSLFLHTWNWGCFHTVSIFLFCPSPGSLHRPLIPNIIHLQSSQCLSSLYTQHSRLFHHEIANQYKQREVASCDTAAVASQKLCKVAHAQSSLTKITLISWFPSYNLIQRPVHCKIQCLLSVLVKLVPACMTTLISEIFFSHLFSNSLCSLHFLCLFSCPQ